MSLDKLVDSTQLDADLTSVANAIRAKGGTSAQLAFPQGFVDAVEAIETGGGFAYETGTFTLTATAKSKVIYHSLGVTPNFCFVFPVDIEKSSDHVLYDIIYQFFFRNIGQADYNISAVESVSGNNHLMTCRVGQASSASNKSTPYNTDSVSSSSYGGYLGGTNVRVGGNTSAGGSGRLVAGTYGYILGVLPV